jgi:hypothetical protein
VGKEYGSSGRFVREEIFPALEARGLYELQRKRFLGLVPYGRWGPTGAGEDARAELGRNVALGERDFGEWVDRDPNRALAYLGLMGPAVLLMTPLHENIQRLNADRRSSDAGGSGNSGGSDPEGDSGAEAGGVEAGGGEFGDGDFGGGEAGGPEFGGGGFDASGLDFGGLDLGAFDAIGDAFSAIDAGVDAGGDGGGGGDGD